jgi:hypothetical protein
MLGRPLLATAVAFAALLPASAALTAGSSKGVTLALPSIETFTLANGLQVAVLPIDGAPVAAVHVWYHVGSKDEAPTRRGSAHMFEHLMFRGSDHVAPEEHARSINRVGGYANAQTEEDATHYVNLVPAAYVDFTLQLEAERMRGLVFRKESIDVERENVKEEIRRADNCRRWRAGSSASSRSPTPRTRTRGPRAARSPTSMRPRRPSSRPSTTRTTSRTTRWWSSSVRPPRPA